MKEYLNSIFSNDFQRKEFFQKMSINCRLSDFKMHNLIIPFIMSISFMNIVFPCKFHEMLHMC